MNNKKGFTIIEVVLAFTFAVILLASMFVIVINYQNKVEKEKIISNLLTYKNSILEIVYHDVISNSIKGMKTCSATAINCIEIETSEDKYKLERKSDDQGNEFLVYRDNNYVLPDSKNNLATFENFQYDYDDQNKIFKVKIPIVHVELENDENAENTIEIVVSGKEFDKEVSKLENPIIVKAIDGLVYNDSNKELVSVQKPKGTVYYSTIEFLDDSNYSSKGSTEIPSKKNAGTYTVYYYVTGNNDYYPKGGSVVVSIARRKVTYKAGDAAKGYDGTPLTNGNVTLISGLLVNNHMATFEVVGTITNFGEVSNVLKKVTIKDTNGIDVSSNYDITKVNGVLSITCQWENTGSSIVTSCSKIDKPTNPKKDDMYVECRNAYTRWNHSSASIRCNNPPNLVTTIPSSDYIFNTANAAISACQSKFSIGIAKCSDGYGYTKECSANSSKYYYKDTYIYQCSTQKDTITINGKTATYTGSEIPANSAILQSNGTVSYLYYESNDCSGDPLNSAPINVGNYSVKVISSGDEIYLTNSVCIPHNITKATPILTLNPISGIVGIGSTKQFTEKANVAGSFTNVSGTTSKVTVSPANHNSVAANNEKTVTITGVANGSSIITVNFIPIDTVNYNSISKTYEANVVTNPTCSFSGPVNSWLKSGASTTYTLNCTDSLAFNDSILSSSDFTLSTSGIVTLSTPVKSTITNGYKYVVTVTSVAQGTTKLTLKSGVLSNTAGGTNAAVTSATVGVDTTLPNVSYNLAGGTYNTTKTVTITASDTGGSGYNYMQVDVWKNGTKVEQKSTSNTTATTFVVNLDSYGTWRIHTRVYDKATNKQSKEPESQSGWYYQDYTIYKPIRVYYNANGGTVRATSTDGTYTYSKDGSEFILRDGSLRYSTANLGGTLPSGGLDDYHGSYLYISKTNYAATSGAEWNSKANGTGISYNQATSYTYEQLLSDPNIIENSTYYRLNVYVNWVSSCSWSEPVTEHVASCTNVAMPSSPSNGSTYVQCTGPLYGKWRYKLTSGVCNGGKTFSAYTSSYNNDSSAGANGACLSKRDLLCSGVPIISGGGCSTEQYRYYRKNTYTYRCP